MHSHLASLTIELLSSWSVVLVDDSTQIIKSRFIDFFAFLFSRNKLTCIYYFTSTYTCIVILTLLHPSVHLALHREQHLLWLSSFVLCQKLLISVLQCTSIQTYQDNFCMHAPFLLIFYFECLIMEDVNLEYNVMLSYPLVSLRCIFAVKTYMYLNRKPPFYFTQTI